MSTEEENLPLSPTPRRWNPSQGNIISGSNTSPFEPSTQSVIDDVERMLAGLDRSPIQQLHHQQQHQQEDQISTHFSSIHSTTTMRSTPASPTHRHQSQPGPESNRHSRTISESDRGRTRDRDSFYTAFEDIPPTSPSRPSPTTRPSFPPPRLRTLTSERGSFYTARERPSSTISGSDSAYASARQTPYSTPSKRTLPSSPLKKTTRYFDRTPSPRRSSSAGSGGGSDNERWDDGSRPGRERRMASSLRRGSDGSGDGDGNGMRGTRSKSSPPGARERDMARSRSGGESDGEGETPRARLFGPRLAKYKSRENLSIKNLPLAPALPPLTYQTIGPSTPLREIIPSRMIASAPSRTPGKASDLIAFFEKGGQDIPKLDASGSASVDVPLAPALAVDLGSPIKGKGKGKMREMDLPAIEEFPRLPSLDMNKSSLTNNQIPPPLPPRPQPTNGDNVFTTSPLVTITQTTQIAPSHSAAGQSLPESTYNTAPLTLTPKRSVRSIVAAWRGRLGSGGSKGSLGPGEKGNQRELSETMTMTNSSEEPRNLMDGAMLTIRRMSTKRKGRREMGELIAGGEIPDRGARERDAGEGGGLPPSLPPKDVDSGEGVLAGNMDVSGDRVRGRLVSTYTEITDEPIRLGHLWYLNVHDPTRGPHWISCDASLYSDRVVLSWEAEARGSRGFVTLDLIHCSEVRSIPSPDHPSAAGDIGSEAARQLLNVDLYPFQLVYEDGVERLACESARDRVRWVSAIWEVLERLPELPETEIGDDVRSDNGSQSTVMAMSPIRGTFARAQRLSTVPESSSSPAEIRLSRAQRMSGISHNSAMGNLDLADRLFRQPSNRLGGGRGPMLRRTTSEADLLLGPAEAPLHSPPMWSRRSIVDAAAAVSPAIDDTGERAWSPVHGAMIEPEMASSQERGFLEHRPSWATITQYHSLAGTLAPQSDRPETTTIAQSSHAASSFITAPVLRQSDYFESQPSDKSHHRDDILSSVSEPFTNSEVRKAISETSTSGLAIPGAASWNTLLTRRPGIKNRPHSYKVDGMGTGGPGSSEHPFDPHNSDSHTRSMEKNSDAPSYATASEGSVYASAFNHGHAYGHSAASSLSGGSAILDVRSSRYQESSPDYNPSSISGRSSAFLDARTNSSQSVVTLSAHESASQIGARPVPTPSDPSSEPSSSSGSYPTSSSDSYLSASTATAKQGTTIDWLAKQAADYHRRTLHALREQEALRLRNAGHVDGQLGRIESCLADVSGFLAMKPPPVPKKDPSPPMPSSGYNSDSSDESEGPKTPTEDSVKLRGLQGAMKQMLDKQSLTNDILSKGITHQPQYDRLEDLLLRLLERSGDSEAAMERGTDRRRTYGLRSKRGDASSSGNSSEEQNAFDGGRTGYGSGLSDIFSLRAGPPPTSQSFSDQSSARHSGIPSSLLAPTPRISSELDEDWEKGNLPSDISEIDFGTLRRAVPPMDLLRGRFHQMPHESSGDEARFVDEPQSEEPQQDEVLSEVAPSEPSVESPEPTPPPRIEHALPQTPSDQGSSSGSESTPRMRPFRPGPPPRPVNIPSPVYPGGRPPLMSSMRPFPPPLPMGSFPQARMSGGRNPMTTTYFRRGFPPGGPMMGMMGPHLGPYTGAFGGPFGPNVFPRPGYMPPGFQGGAYGLPRRPIIPPPPAPRRPGAPAPLTPTETDESTETESSYLTTTPTTAAYEHEHLAHGPPADIAPTASPIVPPKDSRQDTLQQAQGQQQNEISRYLNDLSTVLDNNRQNQQNELHTLHEDIGRIRDQLNRPAAVVQMPLPTDMVTEEHVVGEQPSAAVINISEKSDYGSPVAVAPPLPSKSSDQDQILADLQRRVAELIDQNAANDDMIRERIRSTEQVAADNLNSPIEEMSSGVRFSHPAETVKETTTEVIRGPAGAPAIERKTIKTYNRTGSEILADAPPSHVREEIEEIIQGGDDPDAHLEHSPGDMPIGQEQETSTEIMQGPPRSRSGGARSTVAPVTNMADLPNEAEETIEVTQDPRTGVQRTTVTRRPDRTTGAGTALPHHTAPPSIEPMDEMDPGNGLDPGSRYPSPATMADPGKAPTARTRRPATKVPTHVAQEDAQLDHVEDADPGNTQEADPGVGGGNDQDGAPNEGPHLGGKKSQSAFSRPARSHNGILRERPAQSSGAPVTPSPGPAVHPIQSFADEGNAPGGDNSGGNVPYGEEDPGNEAEVPPASVAPPSRGAASVGGRSNGPPKKRPVPTMPSRLGATSQQDPGEHAPTQHGATPRLSDERLADAPSLGKKGGKGPVAGGGETIQGNHNQHDPGNGDIDIGESGELGRTGGEGMGHPIERSDDIRQEHDGGDSSGQKHNTLKKPSSGSKIKEKISSSTSRPDSNIGPESEQDPGNGKVRFKRDERTQEDLPVHSHAAEDSPQGGHRAEADGPETNMHNMASDPEIGTSGGESGQSAAQPIGTGGTPSSKGSRNDRVKKPIPAPATPADRPSSVHSGGARPGPGRSEIAESGGGVPTAVEREGGQVLHDDGLRDGQIADQDAGEGAGGRKGKLLKRKPSILRERPVQPMGGEDQAFNEQDLGGAGPDFVDGDGQGEGGVEQEGNRILKGKPGAKGESGAKSRPAPSVAGSGARPPGSVKGGPASVRGEEGPATDGSPEAAMSERERIAAKVKAKMEEAEREKLENERVEREKQEAAKLTADRHTQQLDALAALHKMIDALGTDDKKFQTAYADEAKGREKRRSDKVARDKQFHDALDKLIAEKESDKKWRETQAKQPGVKDIIDYLKKSGDDQSAFLRSLAADIVAQNANQHQLTQQAAKAWAKEQVGFNLAGYLDDFSKALSSEVRALLKEVGDLREARRALYYELSELLLLKGRTSSGDLMAVMPWPGSFAGSKPGGGPPGNNNGPPKPPNAPNPSKGGGGPPPPNLAPAWQSFSVPPSMSIGGPSVMQGNGGQGGPPGPPGGNKNKPPGGSRPLPVPHGEMTTTTTTTTAPI